MRRAPLQPLVLCLLALAAWPSLASAAADVPKRTALYYEGTDTRYLLGGEWLFRLDAGDRGRTLGFMRSKRRTGWTAVRAPHAWNVGDHSFESMRGSIGWYRKDFRLPAADAALAWIVRFESVNYRTTVWLNGKQIGEHTGAYIPFELQLSNLRRKGTNRLVVRVDSRRHLTDFPPAGDNADGVPSGGWWNYGGILREVYLRAADVVDWSQVVVRPELRCPKCAATVLVRASMRNVTRRAQPVRVTARYGDRRLDLGRRTIARGATETFERTLRIAAPKLWAPGSPNLYKVRLTAQARGRTLSSYRLRSGIRSVEVVDGRLRFNGGTTNIRGVGFHEDSRERGFAVGNAWRRAFMRRAQDVGATMIRTHYPPHPYLIELADRAGMLVWHEIPVYANRSSVLALDWVRALAAQELRDSINANQNHPSVAVWSLGNELNARPGPAEEAWLREGTALARSLDPTRPIAYVFAGYPTTPCQSEYASLDLIGVNSYFGWYTGDGGELSDRRKLSAYLDELRACYPDQALMVTEFGAEANREGPVEEKGTYAFQQDFVRYHLAVYASKPWLSGALYWALNEFRVKPNWSGGNPRPGSPIHQKGLITYDGVPKPAYADVRRLFRGTAQYARAGR